MRGRIGALTLVCVAVVLAVPAAAAAAGSISGTVTDEAAGHAPIEKVRVCAFREIPGEEEFEFETELGGNCELTNSAGGYTISGLAAGEYAVEFWPGFEGVNYSYEYYENKRSPFEANLVQVTTTAKTGINAELAAGGEIHGKVVKQAGGAPIKEVVVCGEESESPWYVECAVTSATGEYTIVGLPGGEYVVEFLPEFAGLNYVRQYYDGASTWSDAQPVAVAVGATAMNVNAALAERGAITGTVTKPATTVVVAPPPAPIAAPVVKCGKGKVKKLVKGKATCVKRHKKKHHRHAAKHRAAERSLRLAMRQR